MAGQVRAATAASVIAALACVGMLLLFFSGYGSCPQADCDADERSWLLQAGFLGLVAIAAGVSPACSPVALLDPNRVPLATEVTNLSSDRRPPGRLSPCGTGRRAPPPSS